MKPTWTVLVLNRPSESPSLNAGSGKVWGLLGRGVFQRDTGAEAYFGKGTKVTVLEPGRKPEKPNVQILPPSPNECRNQKDRNRKKTLVCLASDFYPDHVSVSWQHNGKDVPEGVGVATDANAKREGDYYSISSRLRVQYEDWHDPRHTFTCIVQFYDGKNTTNIPVTIHGVKNNSTGGGSVTREDYLKTTNAARLSYGVLILKSSVYGVFVMFVVWKLRGSGGKGS